MYIYKLTQAPKWPNVYDAKTGLLMPLAEGEFIVNDIYKDTIDRCLKIKSTFYFPSLGILKSPARQQMPGVSVSDFKLILSKTKFFDGKYKNLFLQSLSKFMPVITVTDYMVSYRPSHVNITAVVFPSRPSVLCISLVSYKKQIKASKFCDLVVAVNANLIDRNIKAGFMTIDFSTITSVVKVNCLMKMFLSFICSDEIIKDQVHMYSRRIVSKSTKKVRFSSKVYCDGEIPRPKLRPMKSILRRPAKVA